MQRTNTRSRTVWGRLALVVMASSMLIAACSGDSASDEMALITDAENPDAPQASGGGDSGEVATDGLEGEYRAVVEDGSVVFQQVGTNGIDAKIIRDGSIDLRIDPGTFDTSASELRSIAADLGGYVASGESHVEELDDERYAVGWYTIRIPSDRFEDAISRVEGLGERVSASVSSQDVSEEYVDLEGRLQYWREQEAFYNRLLAEATTIDDLVTVQTRMQDVLLNIEQIEGRLRYLDSRTDFATLTVGLTEVPDGGVSPVPVDDEPGPIQEAFEQAGEVLLATVGFLIVAAAVAIPIAFLVLFAYIIFRLFLRAARRRETPAEG